MKIDRPLLGIIATFCLVIFILVVTIPIYLMTVNVIETNLSISEKIEKMVTPVEPFDEIVSITVDKYVDGTTDSRWFYVVITVRDSDTNNIEHDYFEYDRDLNKLYGEKNIVTWW